MTSVGPVRLICASLAAPFDTARVQVIVVAVAFCVRVMPVVPVVVMGVIVAYHWAVPEIRATAHYTECKRSHNA